MFIQSFPHRTICRMPTPSPEIVATKMPTPGKKCGTGTIFESSSSRSASDSYYALSNS